MDAENRGTKDAGVLEVLDIEAFARNHPATEEKPEADCYVIRIDREFKRVRESSMTGKEILALVDKTTQSHKLYQKFSGGKVDPVEPADRVSFRAPGVERFQTIPLDTTEGSQR